MSLLPAYDKNNRFIAVVDPRTKALWMTTLILLSFLSDSILEMVVILLLIPVSSVIMRQKLATYKNVLPILLIIASQLVFLQILFCRQGEIIHSWWILDIYSQALPLAAVGILRTSTIVLAVMQFLSFTSALDLQLLLMKCGLPYKYATLAALGIRFMPLIEDEFEAIKDSQSARGLSMNSMVDNSEICLRWLCPYFIVQCAGRKTLHWQWSSGDLVNTESTLSQKNCVCVTGTRFPVSP